MDDKLREEILAKAHEILNDETLLRALIEASDKNLGSKIVDLRSVAMKKMDGELKKLKRSNQQVIATAYENLVGMKQVHQVVLKSLEQNNLDEFITNLNTELCDILRVDCIRLGVETHSSFQNTKNMIQNCWNFSIYILSTLLIPTYHKVKIISPMTLC